ncbi:30S ribosome-binding factor RbfA [Roseomonas sp. USHLN139]|uniref:30S ribosome-binding factor RbfA n=1 Tax=Roseomonas sp. USHLN139 TaxID=3081298 RepID=UPI003FA6A46A
MAKKLATAGAPSQRMLRVAEEVRHALSAVFLRGELHDPDLDSRHITVTEVRASPDLKHMTCFVAALGRAATKEELAGLRRVQPFLRKQVAQAVRLRFAPELHFQPDNALEYASKIDAVMRRPEVAQDLPPRPEKPGEAIPAPVPTASEAKRGRAPLRHDPRENDDEDEA